MAGHKGDANGLSATAVSDHQTLDWVVVLVESVLNQKRKKYSRVVPMVTQPT